MNDHHYVKHEGRYVCTVKGHEGEKSLTLEEYNQNHDDQGRFASGEGGDSTGGKKASGKKSAGGKKSEKELFRAAGYRAHDAIWHFLKNPNGKVAQISRISPKEATRRNRTIAAAHDPKFHTAGSKYQWVAAPFSYGHDKQGRPN